VWSQIGKPYECLGEPKVNIGPAAPLPELGVVDEEQKLAPFSFFPDHAVTAQEAQQTEQAEEEQHQPPSKKKREQQLKYSRASSEMDRMLMKMGLMFFHGRTQFFLPFNFCKTLPLDFLCGIDALTNLLNLLILLAITFWSKFLESSFGIDALTNPLNPYKRWSHRRR
jgi:hypothetical protein